MPSSLQSPRWALSRGSINTSRLIKPLIASCLEFFHTDLCPRMPWKTCTKRMRVGSGLSWTLLTQTPGQPQYWFFPSLFIVDFFFLTAQTLHLYWCPHTTVLQYLFADFVSKQLMEMLWFAKVDGPIQTSYWGGRQWGRVQRVSYRHVF